jgi:hypothetical protein
LYEQIIQNPMEIPEYLPKSTFMPHGRSSMADLIEE